MWPNTKPKRMRPVTAITTFRPIVEEKVSRGIAISGERCGDGEAFTGTDYIPPCAGLATRRAAASSR